VSHRRTKSFEPFILRTIRPKSTNTLKKRGVNTWADGGRVSVGFSLCYKSSFHYGKMTSVTHFVEKADLEKKSSEGTTSISAPSCLRHPLGSDSDSWTPDLFASLATSKGLRPGDFVTVALSEPTLENIIKLPSSALNADSAVLVLTEDERLEIAEVRVFRQQGDHILVRGRGLSGREVVAEQTPVLGSGIKVKPLRSGEASTPKEPEVVELSPERRAKLIAAIEGNAYIPKDAKERILKQLKQDKVPAKVVERIESRMGG